VEDLGGQVLGLAAAAGSAGDERVHSVEVSLVQRREALWVRLGGLDQEALVVSARGNPIFGTSTVTLVRRGTFVSCGLFVNPAI